ncbi:UNVERIFIED_CONTAM: hypothetical protein HDU68_001162 [Siphonaria sp. JEL0065]|nr:hypothetical protein HDU68_001162 [Siphonaria sp. JEL0065]
MTDLIDYSQVENDIRAILKRPGYDNGNIGPVLVRLAWHSAGTYSKHDGTGGSNGATMRFAPESTDGANAGLDVARAFLEPIKEKHPAISYADLWTLAGIVSIEALGGPRVSWVAGRVDFPVIDDDSNKNNSSKENELVIHTGCPVIPKYTIPENGRLPDAALDATHLRFIFNRMGFNDRDIVALSGAHTLGMCHTDRSGYDGVWTHFPNEFSNRFFKVLLELKWKKRDWDDWTGPEQYMDEETEQLMMLPTDMALLWDPAFKVIVEEYAQDQDLFFKDFSSAFGRLLELGVPRRSVSVVEEAGERELVQEVARNPPKEESVGWFKRSKVTKFLNWFICK